MYSLLYVSVAAGHLAGVSKGNEMGLLSHVTAFEQLLVPLLDYACTYSSS